MSIRSMPHNMKMLSAIGRKVNQFMNRQLKMAITSLIILIIDIHKNKCVRISTPLYQFLYPRLHIRHYLYPFQQPRVWKVYSRRGCRMWGSTMVWFYVGLQEDYIFNYANKQLCTTVTKSIMQTVKYFSFLLLWQCWETGRSDVRQFSGQ